MSNEILESDIEKMLKCIPAPQPYGAWLKIVSAVFSVLPLGNGCQLLQSWAPEKTPGEYATKHRTCLQEIGIGSLIHIARQHGWKGTASGWKGKLASPTISPGVLAAILAAPRPSWMPPQNVSLLPLHHKSQTAPAPLPSPEPIKEPAPCSNVDDAEAHRIAGELHKIHAVYPLDNEPEQAAVFAAAVLKFEATFDRVEHRDPLTSSPDKENAPQANVTPSLAIPEALP